MDNNYNNNSTNSNMKASSQLLDMHMISATIAIAISSRVEHQAQASSK